MGFLLSGASALVYQVGWQRLLFSHLGVELTTVTVVISAFMLGLGLGGLVGGALVDRFPSQALTLFAMAEAGVGLYGLCSPYLLDFAGEQLLFVSTGWLALAMFALVLPPTLLMGATLPVLVTYLSARWLHVGRSTSTLYALNTVGAALGALLTGYLMFHHLGLNEVLRMAAIVNLLVAVGTTVFVQWWGAPS